MLVCVINIVAIKGNWRPFKADHLTEQVGKERYDMTMYGNTNILATPSAASKKTRPFLLNNYRSTEYKILGDSSTVP